MRAGQVRNCPEMNLESPAACLLVVVRSVVDHLFGIEPVVDDDACPRASSERYIASWALQCRRWIVVYPVLKDRKGIGGVEVLSHGSSQ